MGSPSDFLCCFVLFVFVLCLMSLILHTGWRFSILDCPSGFNWCITLFDKQLNVSKCPLLLFQRIQRSARKYVHCILIYLEKPASTLVSKFWCTVYSRFPSQLLYMLVQNIRYLRFCLYNCDSSCSSPYL